MARLLSRATLLHFPQTNPLLLTPLSLHFSSKPTASLYELDLSSTSSPSSSSEEEEVVDQSSIISKLEDAVHHVMLLRSTPDWVPFVPGSSFWVPPNKRPVSLKEFVNNISDVPSRQESLSLATCRGFPSSQFFLPSNDSSSGKADVKITVVRVGRVDVEVKEQEEGEEADALADKISEEG